MKKKEYDALPSATKVFFALLVVILWIAGYWGRSPP